MYVNRLWVLTACGWHSRCRGEGIGCLFCRELVVASCIISPTSCVRILRLGIKVTVGTRAAVDALPAARGSGLARVSILASLLVSRLAMCVNDSLTNLHQRFI